MSAATDANSPGLTPAARRSMYGGIISLVVDSYDIYVPALVLPAAMNFFEPASMSPALKATMVSVVFTVTLLARPVGGTIFGNLGDKIGRKKITMMAGVGFTVTTLIIGLLPGYHQWGYGALAVLIALRFIDGVFLGGGYAGPVPLAIERSPARLRGLVGGIVAAGAPLAIFFISVVQLTALEPMAPDAYSTWGWRIPFFFGVALGIGYLIYYARVPEVDVESLKADRKTRRQPLFELFTGPNAKSLLQVFLLMTGMWFAAQMLVSFLPGLLISVLHQDPSNVSVLEIVMAVFTGAAMIGFAALSQRVGRRTVLSWAAGAVTVVASLAFAFMVAAAKDGSPFLTVAILAIIASVLVNGPLGTIVTYLNERFGKGVRSSGYGTAYTVSLILPSLYSIWIGLLTNVMPFEYAPVVLIALGGLLFTVGSLMGPETVTHGTLAAEDAAPASATAATTAGGGAA